MIRIVLERMALFALPFMVFALYAWVFHRRFKAPQPGTPWFWLTAAGLILVILSFLYAGFADNEGTGGTYVAPQYVNGKIVPAHVDEGKTKTPP